MNEPNLSANYDLANKPMPNEFLVVGLGASAGGIQALKEFFEHVPADTGMAYVVILHLSPEHDSKLAQVLQTVTKIPVTQVTEKVEVEPNHVYVVPPNQHLEMQDGTIIVSLNTLMEERRAPVDIFFRTLAESHGSRAVAVVLSGTGANGSMGLKRVKEKGGAAFVQNPREAEFNEMPRNAIATDLVDDILSVAEIPARIIAYKRSLGTVEIPIEPEARPEDQQQALREVFTQLRVRTGHDFSNYKRPTLLRRIERRINIRNLPNLPAYASFMRDNPEETQALLKDLLISVTNFFRDHRAFDTVEQDILPRIFEGKKGNDQVRIWTVGCATGEEAYSIAMLCAERTMGMIDAPKVQIFATDIDEAAITTAREGLYTINDAADVSPERLRRFFTKEGDEFRIRREIREMVLFANHNVIKDPPFSRLDLVTCRNMLIYLNHTAQERVMETLHFALKPGGYLFLGGSESVDGASDLFASVSREHHIFQSRLVSSRPYPVPESVPLFRFEPPRTTESAQERENRALERITYGDLHQQLLEQYAPPSVVVNEEYDIVHLSERAGRYLQMAGGEPSNNLLKLIRQELRLELRSALYQAVQRNTNVQARNLKVRVEEHTETINIHVRPVLREGDTARGFLLVLFEQVDEQQAEEVLVASDEPVARQLEEELIRLKGQLRASIEQHELQAEELKASNEELQAMNEELRSAAEELETSKEELQSINEELTTVNQELKVKVEEVTITSNNLQNLINSTDIATIFLDRSLRVNLFSPATRSLFNLIPADFGRPLSDITHRLAYDDLLSDAEIVLEKLQTVEKEINATDGRSFLMRVLPYRTSEDRIQGVVITFVDITERKQAEAIIAANLRDTQLLRELSARLTTEENIQTLYNEIMTAAITLMQANAGTVQILDEGTGELLLLATQGFGRTMTDHFYRVNASSNTPCGIALAKGDRTFVDFEVPPERDPDGSMHMHVEAGYLSAQSTPLIARSGKAIGIVSTHWRKSGYRPTERELRFLDLLARQAADLLERRAAQEALHRSEEKYRTLFDSIDEGYCLMEMIYDEAGRPVDLYFLEANPTYEKQAGFAPSGKKISDFVSLEPFWFETYNRVLETGEPERIENYVAAQDRWYHVFASRIGGAGSKLIAAVFDDITERKRTEETQAFFLKLSDALRSLNDPVAVRETAMRILGEHLGVNRAFYGEVLDDQDTIIFAPGYANTLTQLVGPAKFSDFDTDMMETYRAGQMVVINEIYKDIELTPKARAQFDAIQVRAAVGVPLVKGGKVCSILSVHQSKPRRWTGSELTLLEETAERTWAAVERAHAETALRESEARLRIALEAADLATWSWNLLTDEVYWNERHFLILGRDPQTNPVKPEDFFNHVHEDDRAWLNEKLRRAIAENSLFNAQFRVRLTTGELRWMEGYGQAVETQAGKVTRMSGVMGDITERKRAEEALRDSEERLRLTMESVTDFAIFTTNNEGLINSWNVGAEHMFGYTEAEIIGQPAAIIFTPEDRAAGAPEEELRKAVTEGRAADERWHVRKDGSRFYVSGVTSAIHDGKNSGFVKIARDLTERHQNEEELRRSREQLEQAVQERTKELSAAFESLVREVGERRAAEQQVKELLRKIITAQESERRRLSRELHDSLGQQLTALRMGLDSMARSEKIETTERFTDLSKILKRLDSDVDFLAWELRPASLDELGLVPALSTYVEEWSKQFGITADFHANAANEGRFPYELETNLYRITQEALNNIAKHAKASQVSVLLEHSDGHLALIIEDNGVGFRPLPENLAVADKGLGLVGIRERATLIGGTVEIESSPTNGTTIFARVPLSPTDK